MNIKKAEVIAISAILVILMLAGVMLIAAQASVKDSSKSNQVVPGEAYE